MPKKTDLRQYIQRNMWLLRPMGVLFLLTLPVWATVVILWGERDEFIAAAKECIWCVRGGK